MKKRNLTLAVIPAVITAIVFIGVISLYLQLKSFKNSYLDEAENVLKIQAEQTLSAIIPIIEEKNFEKLQDYCQKFEKVPLRITVFSKDGKAIGESQTDDGNLGDHSDRPEFKDALVGNKETVVRYSATLNMEMIYYSLAFSAGKEEYVLRLSISTKSMSNFISHSKRNIFFAMVFGAALSLASMSYSYLKVRIPFDMFKKSAVEIANGNLEAEIYVPQSGILTELASAVSAMSNRLKQTIKTLTKQRNERDVIFNAMSEAILVASPDGKLSSWNKPASQIFGIKQSLRNAHIANCSSEELIKYVNDAFKNSRAPEREITYVCPDKKFTLLLRGVFLENNGSKNLLISITDLTNLRKLESFRSEFVANVSHEIKTPLTGILSASELLEDIASSPETSKCVKILKTQSQRLNSLVDDILSLSSLESASPSKYENFKTENLADIIRESIAICRDKASQKEVSLNLKECEDTETKCDRKLLEQAITNLIFNAIKYSQSKNVDISLSRSANNAKITVKDYGIGIAKEHAERIFERFYRVDKNRSRELGGTGLGLAIVKHVAWLHGGDASLKSEPKKGAEFSISIPIK